IPIKLRKANTPKREILGYHKVFKSMAKYWKSNHNPVFPKLFKIYGIKIKKKPNITIKEFNENKVDCLAQADPKIITKVTSAPRKIDLQIHREHLEFVKFFEVI
ncbi:hypothetical protein V7052_05060, partial [Bacillus wiedmannii]|uniref:hypothetical protein n=2 Tax=Bacillaceae TaxID=186817 RepID=UPI003000EC65